MRHFRLLLREGQPSVAEEVFNQWFDFFFQQFFRTTSNHIPVGSGACRRFPGGARPAPAGPNPACTISIHQAHPSTLNAMQLAMAGDTDPLAELCHVFLRFSPGWVMMLGLSDGCATYLASCSVC